MTESELELLESIESFCKTDAFSQTVMDVFNEAKCLVFQEDKLRKEIEQLKETLVLSLKPLIGQPIYWANPNWRMETHTITGVEYRTYDSDFFDTKEVKYKGKKCIVIEVDGCGNYLADFIGRTLFFDKEEAKKHARQE